jgi:hypothetical protein
MIARVTVSAACATLLSGGVASAGRDEGSLGVGVDTTLSASTSQAGPFFGPRGALAESRPLQQPGLSAVFQATERVGVELILSFDRASSSPGGVDQSSTALQFAVRGLYALELADQIDLAGFAGLGIGRGSASAGDMSASGSDLAIEVGVRPEWFVTAHLSLHTQIGLVIGLLSEDNPIMSTAGTDLNLFGSADLLGNAGFTFWF